MNKTFVILIILVIVVAAVWMFTREQVQAPEVQRPDTTNAIQQDVNSIDLGDLDKEFQSIDSEINQL